MEKIDFFILVAAGIVTSVLLSLPVWLLWNACLVGAVAGVQPVAWLQAWGLVILCNALFKPTNSRHVKK
jgi:hypothetical protein